ncbi:MAG: hypothetical protein ACR2MR_07825 [Dietzia maris]
MSRTVTRLRRVALAAVLLATPLLGPLATAPAALAQSLDDPAWPADRPFPPATDGPFGWAELSYWPYAVAPSDPQFWAPNGAPMRVLSPFGTDTEIWCSNYVSQGSDCWQRDPSGTPHRLHRITVLSDVITGSTGSAADGSVRGAYDLAYELEWPTTSGGIGIPAGTVPGSTTTTWVSLMPLSPFGADSRDFDVWVHPGFVPGS